jgi:SAM-dependent methyltransferase
MNRFHRWYCRSSHWKVKLEDEILPWSLNALDLGGEVLEVGPGPGLTTEWLRHRYKSVTCIEVDQQLASSLGQRMRNTNIIVDCGDATAMPYRDHTFSGAVSFTMLHHVSSRALQDRLFAEVFRVLKPGGIFAGTDSMPSFLMKIVHLRDTMLLVEPESLAPRLDSVGFRDVRIEIGSAGRFRFYARRPSENGQTHGLSPI